MKETDNVTPDTPELESFAGIPHLTRDRYGRFYSKDNLVECANGYDPAALRKFAEGVADMCREIEAQGKEANFSNVVIFMKEKFQHLNVGYDVTRIKDPAEAERLMSGVAQSPGM